MWLLDKIIPAPWRWAAAGIAALVLIAAIGVQTVRLANSKAELATEKADRAKETAKQYAALTKALQDNADQQAAHAAATLENANALNQATRARAAAQRAADAAADSLRHAIHVYAAVGGAQATPDPAACRGAADRAATLGNLLEDALGTATTLAAAAEQHADEVRILKRQDQADRGLCGASSDSN